MEARLQSEIAFHNKRFAEGNRGVKTPAGLGDVEKYYSVVGRSRSFYLEQIQEGCQGKRVLEYGCATCGHTRYLPKRGARVTGIDISDVAVREAQRCAEVEQIEALDYRVMNAEVLEFDDNSFDLIYGNAILHHLDLKKAFAELARTMKPDGMGVFLEPLGHNPLINLYRRLTPGVRTPDEHPFVMRDFKLARTYFGKVELRYFHLLSLLAVPFRHRRFFGPLLRRLDTVDATLFRAVPLAGRYAWAAVVCLSLPARDASNR